MPKESVPGESTEDRFRRLATARTNEVLKRLKILGNCANRQLYSYTEKDIEKIFSAKPAFSNSRQMRSLRAGSFGS